LCPSCIIITTTIIIIIRDESSDGNIPVVGVEDPVVLEHEGVMDVAWQVAFNPMGKG